MSAPLRLVVFDVDGTLVDSQGDILAAMAHAFASVGLTAPDRKAVLGIVGLSLEVAMVKLAPQATPQMQAQMVTGYKDGYLHLRREGGVEKSSPMYPGGRAMLQQLHATPELLLGIATGKSQRGLDKLLTGHALTSLFVTRQVADHHPSKPHPSMLQAACAETGIAAEQAVMIGDTSFDMQMARAADIPAIGVSWGYHDVARLTDADIIIDDFAELPDALNKVWRL